MLFPKANKTNLAKLVREKGYDIPSIRQAYFTNYGRSYFLRWQDADLASHVAYYTGSAGRPVLQVDKEWYSLAMEEVIRFGLIEERRKKA